VIHIAIIRCAVAWVGNVRPGADLGRTPGEIISIAAVRTYNRVVRTGAVLPILLQAENLVNVFLPEALIRAGWREHRGVDMAGNLIVIEDAAGAQLGRKGIRRAGDPSQNGVIVDAVIVVGSIVGRSQLTGGIIHKVVVVHGGNTVSFPEKSTAPIVRRSIVQPHDLAKLGIGR